MRIAGFVLALTILIVASDFRLASFPGRCRRFDHFNRDDHRLSHHRSNRDFNCEVLPALTECHVLLSAGAGPRLAKSPPRIRAHLPPLQHVSSEAPSLTTAVSLLGTTKCRFLSLFVAFGEGPVSDREVRKQLRAIRHEKRRTGWPEWRCFGGFHHTDLQGEKGLVLIKRYANAGFVSSPRSLMSSQPAATPFMADCDFIVGMPLAARKLLGCLPLR